MKKIFEYIRQETVAGHDLVLTSIISQEGSSPRGLGAQMLVGAEGRLCGTVGGGAVELQCIRFGQKVLEEKQSCEKFFSLTPKAKENIGMVCGGDVTVWFQYIDSSLSFWGEFSELLLTKMEERIPGWLVLHQEGGLPSFAEAGAEGEKELPGIGDFGRREGRVFLPIPIGERAVIFGGGHCSQALVPILNTVGFRVTVMDNRSEYASRELFPGAEAVICGDFRKLSEHLVLSESDYVVIMTNGHSFDYEVERQVLQNPPCYVGAIGSQHKKEFVNGKLREAGIAESVIQQVHCPIGTAIRAVTPEEIAISIAGEMILERARMREGEKGGHHGCPMS